MTSTLAPAPPEKQSQKRILVPAILELEFRKWGTVTGWGQNPTATSDHIVLGPLLRKKARCAAGWMGGPRGRMLGSPQTVWDLRRHNIWRRKDTKLDYTCSILDYLGCCQWKIKTISIGTKYIRNILLMMRLKPLISSPVARLSWELAPVYTYTCIYIHTYVYVYMLPTLF